MKSRLYLFMLALGIAIFPNCGGMFEPESKTGGIIINFESLNPQDGADPFETLTTIRCVLTKGTKTIHSNTYTITGPSFQIDILDVKESDDYFLKVYGRNKFGCITQQAMESDISVSENQNTTVQVAWERALERGTVTDIDGNVYETIKIGDQWWMAENLKVTHYRNGEALPEVRNPYEWDQLESGAWCVYENNAAYAETHGLIYNWYAVDDARQLAPEGWHIPSDEEWKQLELTLGMSPLLVDEWGYRGADEGSKMKSIGTLHDGSGLWIEKNIGASNESCFSALPSGWRIYTGVYYSMGQGASFWTATEYGELRAWSRSLSYRLSNVLRSYGFKGRGFSIRCVMD